MSRTTTIAIYPGEKTEEIEEYGNSWGSAPPVWEAMAREYLGNTVSYNSQGTGWMQLGDKLWDLWKDPRVKMEHRLVFMLTFDRAYIAKKNYKRMADAIRVFLADFPIPADHANHWPAFAALFDSDPAYPGVGLYCTSVSENPFLGEYNDDTDEYDPIDWDTVYEICERIDEEFAPQLCSECEKGFHGAHAIVPPGESCQNDDCNCPVSVLTNKTALRDLATPPPDTLLEVARDIVYFADQAGMADDNWRHRLAKLRKIVAAQGVERLENKAEDMTRAFILRERIGWLRTMRQYVPPVLRQRYLQALDEVAALKESMNG